jgi:antitoxin ParD1/3/4
VALPKAEKQQKDEEFEAIANNLAEDFKLYVGKNIPNLSDYAVSREEIYEEHH